MSHILENLMFNVEIAKKIGVDKAIIFQQIYYRIKANKENNINYESGFYWCRLSASNVVKSFFPFWSKEKVKRLLRDMCNDGIISSGKISNNLYDRTNYYRFDDESDELLGLNPCLERHNVVQMIEENPLVKNNPSTGQIQPVLGGELTHDKDKEHCREHNKEHFVRDETLKPITPVGGTPPEFSVEKEFEELWKDYPKKVGKPSSLKYFKKTVKKKEDLENIKKALTNYKSMLASEEWRKPQDGSTWFNRWKDWVEYCISKNERSSWGHAL